QGGELPGRPGRDRSGRQLRPDREHPPGFPASPIDIDSRVMEPRTILYTGKGGVGKTSVAACTARACARAGLRTLVISTDPAHSLSESLGAELGPEPSAARDRLWGPEVNAPAEV